MSETIASGRALRLWKVGSLTTQVASSYLWQSVLRPFRSADGHERELLEVHVRNALRIVESSKELRGAFTKLVQMLSMRSDLFPEEALEILAATCSAAPAMDYDAVRAALGRELGKPPERLFASFEREAFAAASLAQVHRAELRTGEAVAVKVQYPGVAEAMEQDLRNVAALLDVLGRLAKDVFGTPVDVDSVRKELEERLSEELDYEREADNLRLFGRLFAADEDVEVPVVVPELSSTRVLTMTFLEGYPLGDFFSPTVDRELRDWIGVTCFKIVWRQLLRFGVLHTDPHPGNYLVSHHPRLAILDFGSVRRFPETLRRNYVRLARALLDGDRTRIVAASKSLGFLGRGDSADAYVAVLDTLLEPLLEDREYDPGEYRTTERVTRAAQLVVDERLLRAPGHRVFLLRALLGLESVVKQLGTVANWRRLFAEEVEAAEAARV